MVVSVQDQAPALLSIRQRRLTMLVMAGLLLLFLWVSETHPFEPLHAAAMATLTLVLIVLSFYIGIGHPTLRIGGMAAATIGLMLLSRDSAATPIGAYIVILDATQHLRLRKAVGLTGVLCATFLARQFWAPGGLLAGWIPVAFNLGFFIFAFVLLYGARRLRDEQFRVHTLLAELEARRDRDLAAAKTEERTRLARDIHDVLAHSLTALIVQLDSARMVLTGERASEEAVGSVLRARHLAQEGLDETRGAGGARISCSARPLPDRPGGSHERPQARAGKPGAGPPPLCRGRRGADGGRLRPHASAEIERGRGRLRTGGHARARRAVGRQPRGRSARHGFPRAPVASRITVVVVDDQRLVREGLLTMLRLMPEVEVVGAAGDGLQALELIAEKRPAIVLMDLRMPRCDGVEATRRIRDEYPSTRVVVLTTYADDESIFGALQAGARGYLTKDAGPEELLRAIQTVHAGQALLDPIVQSRLLDRFGKGAPRPASPAPNGLTPREVEVLGLIAQGLSNRQIQERLSVTEATVKSHVNSILSKAGLRDRAQAVSYAFRNRLTGTL